MYRFSVCVAPSPAWLLTGADRPCAEKPERSGLLHQAGHIRAPQLQIRRAADCHHPGPAGHAQAGNELVKYSEVPDAHDPAPDSCRLQARTGETHGLGVRLGAALSDYLGADLGELPTGDILVVPEDGPGVVPTRWQVGGAAVLDEPPYDGGRELGPKADTVAARVGE